MTFSFSKEDTAKLKDLAVKEEVTLSTIFHTLWGILLQAYNQTEDAVLVLLFPEGRLKSKASSE